MQYSCYAGIVQTVLQTRKLFLRLFKDYLVCLKCVFKIYNFQYPKLYSDPGFYLQLLGQVFGDDSYLKDYNVMECCLAKECWVCEKIFQQSYLYPTVQQIIGEINRKSYGHYTQYKLNIRIPNIIILKQILLARFTYEQFKREGEEVELKLMYNVLVVPLESNRSVDAKAVLKWMISHALNSQTPMTSTAEDHPQNLTISIEQNYTDGQAVEASVMGSFKDIIELDRKKPKKTHKKVHHDEDYQVRFKTTAANVNQILQLKQHEYQPLFNGLSFPRFLQLMTLASTIEQIKTISHVTHTVTLFTQNLYLCGKYIKFSRYLSQTPWVVNGKKLTEGSLQEQIEDKIFWLFYPGKLKGQIEVKFHSGGREDIDVRMLKGGRPFVLQFVNPIRAFRDVLPQQVCARLPESLRPSEEIMLNTEHTRLMGMLLETLINHNNQYVQVREFSLTTESYISVELKAAETQKIKHYICYIYSIREFTPKDKLILDSASNIQLKQLTPIRVMHRRSLIHRDKVVHKLKFHQVSAHSGVLQVWASAGTYIKEFVHGDLGRTVPNVGMLLQSEVDILQLDVGSLKEGQWQEGDDKLMKMDRMAWMENDTQK